MCIPFGGMGGQSIEAPTEKTKNSVSILKKIMYFQLGLACLELILLFMGSSGFNSLLYDLMSCCIIYMAYSQLSYCYSMMYIFFLFYRAIEGFIFFGTCIQDNINPFNKGGANSFAAMVIIISFLFCCVAIYYSFGCYKEFKALSLGSINEPLQQESKNNQNYDYERQQSNEIFFF